MGMSPASANANLYIAIYELNCITPLLGKYLLCYKRFNDNGFAIWLHDLNPTMDAKNGMTSRPYSTRWVSARHSSPRKKLVFMDMTIQVKGERIITTIYDKPLALYQYIPPNSCHPPEVLTGLIFGQIDGVHHTWCRGGQMQPWRMHQ